MFLKNQNLNIRIISEDHMTQKTNTCEHNNFFQKHKNVHLILNNKSTKEKHLISQSFLEFERLR